MSASPNKCGIDHQPAGLVVQQRQRERLLGEAVDDLADDVGALVAKEQAGQHLQLEVGAQRGVAHAPAHGLCDEAAVARQVVETAAQVEVADHLRQHLRRSLCAG